MGRLQGARSTEVDWQAAGKKAASTARWAVTMTKVRIRRVLSRTRWQLVTFIGPGGGESIGVVDMLAVRKDHRKVGASIRRGDALQLILIQVKGGSAAKPTADDGRRLRTVCRLHGARAIVLAAWKRGQPVRFFTLNCDRGSPANWVELTELEHVFA